MPPSPPGETTVHTPVLTLPLLEDTNISFGVWSTSSTTRSVWLWEKLEYVPVLVVCLTHDGSLVLMFGQILISMLGILDLV